MNQKEPTYWAAYDQPVADNLLQREFTAERPHQRDREALHAIHRLPEERSPRLGERLFEPLVLMVSP